MLLINPERTSERMYEWMERTFRKARHQKAVLGLSGGLDSAVVAFIAANSIGKDNLECVKLPYRTSSPSSIADADKIIEILGVKSRTVDISGIADAFSASLSSVDPHRFGNVLARIRMTVLFDIAGETGSLVLGTSNKSERYLGYGTIYGDLASVVNPIGELYKTQVRDLAKFIGVPQEIIDKKPSADLIEGQTDEGDFGFSYHEADEILDAIYDEKKSKLDVTNLGYNLDLIDEVLDRVRFNEFKKEIPYIFDPRAF
ncbi:MAG TPA: NAD+ synthase [Clostridiales bacterium]|nr:NAD+ synthase [Clostridiales bacterium]